MVDAHRCKWLDRRDLDSWSEFKELIGNVVVDKVWGVEPESYWYRGHAIANWKLRSSFDRMFASVEPSQRRNVHQAMLDGLKDRLDSSEVEELSEVGDRIGSGDRNKTHELAAVAQHYGTPTRMLDWSESPYIGAFFALADFSIGHKLTSDDGTDDSCSIVALNTLAAAWNSDLGVELVRTDRRMNARLRHQRGVFTLNSSTFATLEDYCEEFYRKSQKEEIALIKITIPRSAAPGALRDLELMGITSESMFPGLEGAAKYAFVRAVDRHIWRTP